MPSIPDAAALAQLGSALDLAGRTVVVTGATSGIGEAVALGLAGMNVNVLALGRRKAELDRVAAAAAADGLTLRAAVADVTDEESLDAVMDQAVSTFGALFGVVANAGIAVVQPALEVSASDFRSVVDTNLTGAFLTVRSAARKMSGGGAVVITSSSFARRGFNDWSSYNASKAGVSMLAQTLATEWIGRGIRVNAVAPTATLTAVNQALFADEAFTAGVLAGIPARRILQAPELVLPFAFLLSPRNEMLIGQTLYVDGGQAL
jgi:NAD(P)-dependent dehydrogenase (short-subunit alcohol dehydrogenase family)